jgi:hypothetical protein
MPMNAPSRREFVTYAAAATLGSALPASAQATDKPLTVDVFGPMAVQWSGSRFDVWMPELDGTHEAGITTPVTSFDLGQGTYDITGTASLSGTIPAPYPPAGRTLYQVPNAKPPKQYYVKLSLPRPFHIVLLHPVLCKIWSGSEATPSKSTSYATGLRLLYPRAGAPVLKPPQKDKVISFDPAPDEVQMDMMISYVPYSYMDRANDSKAIFQKLAKDLGLENLQIECDEYAHTKTEAHSQLRAVAYHPRMVPTAHRPCKSPIIQLR